VQLLKTAIDVIRGFFPPQVPIWVKGFFLIAMLFAGAANVFGYLILIDTNEDKLKDKKDALFLWYPQKSIRIFKEYEQKFPDGRKAFWYKVFLMIGSLSFMLSISR
jgi:hypothetical protein